ncbi:MAG: sugar phosphate nucleotidyltransferase [Phycisphaerae bacterium]
MTRNATVVILAGGKGTRLAPYTTVLPKPLMPVGEMPILQIVLSQLRYYGFRNVVISVGYLAELIMAFFGDGSKIGMNIRYAIEDEPLGTIGPVRRIEGLSESFIVMNGDLLTDIDYGALFDYHAQGKQLATVATYRRDVQVSLGVLEYDTERRMTAFREKPTNSYACSMGIYVYNRAIIEVIPPNVHYGFDNLMCDMLARNQAVKVYPYQGLWLDIGRHEDYQVATEQFHMHRKRFLPDAESSHGR